MPNVIIGDIGLNRVTIEVVKIRFNVEVSIRWYYDCNYIPSNEINLHFYLNSTHISEYGCHIYTIVISVCFAGRHQDVNR